jgi:hypothetical protein
MVLPAEVSSLAIRSANRQGSYTLLGFFDTFIHAAYNGTAAQRAYIRLLANWWRLACTNQAGGATEVSIALLPSATSTLMAKVTSHVSRVVSSQTARIGLGGPGLTTAAFAQGIAEVKTTLENNLAQQLAHDTARGEKTFTDVHGTALAQILRRLCGVASDADLPPIHNLLIKTNKSQQQYSVLGGALAERTNVSPLHLSSSHVPMVTVSLMENVFRSFRISGEGLEFGKGLTPFAIICPGHGDAASTQLAATRASTLESGTSATLADIATLTSGDPLFPTEAFITTEKLYAWSIEVDVFHGTNHPIAVAIRQAVSDVCPTIQRTCRLKADNSGAWMEIVCRLLYELQQEYFGWVSKTSNAVPTVVPTFERIVGAVTSYPAESLYPMPSLCALCCNCSGKIMINSNRD